MKVIYLFFSGILIFLFQSCNNFKSTHPQAGLSGEVGATGMTDKSILIFTSAIDRQLSNFKKEFSLIYTSGDLSLYAEKYSQYNDGMLYKNFSSNGNINNIVKSYYFKNDSLVLVKERTIITEGNNQILKDTRTYLRNNIAFKIESRTDSSPRAIRGLPYSIIQLSENKNSNENYSEDIKIINDAVYGKGRFEMVFQNITTYPDALYITLKSKEQNNYSANILVKDKDMFIDSLLNMSSIYKNEKLNIKWRIADKEAVYVPVAETVTSAKGLNK